MQTFTCQYLAFNIFYLLYLSFVFLFFSNSFSFLGYRKYERLKSVVESFKKNEETLNAALSEKQANIDKMQNMYDMLKSHAVAKLEK